MHKNKKLSLIKGKWANFDILKMGVVQLKKTLSLLTLAAAITGCAVFTGRETAGEYIDDAGITTSVKNEINQDPTLRIFQIHVETFQNTVQLSGFVDSRRDIQRAGQIARSVKGVHDVKNNLVIRKHY